MADGVALVVGDRHAPRGLRVVRGGGGQVAGQPRVDRAQAGQLAGPVRQAGQGDQRDGQGDPAGEPGGNRAARGLWPSGRPRRRAGAGVLAQQQVQVGAGAELVHAALQPGLLQFVRPGGDLLVRGQHLVRGELAAHQRGVAGVLGPPLHPGEPRRGLPALPRLVRGDFDHRAGDRGAQPGRGQPGGPVQHLGLGGAGLVLIEQRGGRGDDLGLVPASVPSSSAACGAGQPGVQVGPGPIRLVRPGPGLPQRVGDLVRGELRVQPARGSGGPARRPRPACGRRRGPRPGPRRTAPRPARPPRRRRSRRPPRRRRRRRPPARAAGQHVQRHPRAERGRGAGRLAGKTRAEPGWPGPAPARWWPPPRRAALWRPPRGSRPAPPR